MVHDVNSFASAVDPDALLLDVRRLEYRRDASGIEMTALQGVLPKWLKDCPAIVAALEELDGEITAVMVNRLASGVVVPEHVDPPSGDRYHLPIVTNPWTRWWDVENGSVHMEVGSWWGPVPYTELHRVLNPGASERIHLVVDVKGN